MRAVFEQAAAAGLTVVRTFAHTTETKHPLQAGPGRAAGRLPSGFQGGIMLMSKGWWCLPGCAIVHTAVQPAPCVPAP